jgi:hypothetical protein
LNSVVNGPSATVILPSSAFAVTYSRKGIFQCVQLPQDQPAQVTVQFAPTELPPAQLVPPPLPQIVKAEAIDGGILVAGPLATIPNRQNVNVNHILSGSIQSNGTFTFTFVPAHHPGLYQVRLQRGSQIIGLQFWVADPQRPANNPPTMIAPALAINPIQPIL